MTDINEESLDSLAPTAKPPKKKKRFVKKIVKLLFVLILIGLIALSYYYFRRHHHAYKTTQVITAHIAQVTQAQVQQLQQQQQLLLEQQTQILAKLQQHGVSNQPLVLANVVFLLQRATLQLQTEHDPVSTIELLQLASTNLQRLHGPIFVGVQQAIATDLKTLQAIKMPDVNQLTQQFYALSQQVSELSLALSQQNVQKPTQQKQLQGWKKMLDDTWQSLRDVVIVERTDKSFKPLMNQQDLFSFKQYMQSLLQQALWAALKQNNTIYHTSLQQLQHALSTNIAKSNVDANQLQQAFIRLQAMNVQPAIPTQLHSLPIAIEAQTKLLQVARKVS